jgi:hypothetical protein
MSKLARLGSFGFYSSALFDSLSSAAIRLDHTTKPFVTSNVRNAIGFPRSSKVSGNRKGNRCSSGRFLGASSIEALSRYLPHSEANPGRLGPKERSPPLDNPGRARQRDS